MRVLIIDPAGGLWGSERALVDLIAAAENIEIAVCCPPATPLDCELKRIGVRTLPYYVADLHRKPRWRRLQATAGVLRACLAFRPNVIHLNQSGAYRVVQPIAACLRVPMVSHVRIFEDVAYLASCRPCSDRLRALIAVSHAMKAEIRRFPALAALPTYQIYDAYLSVAQLSTAPPRRAHSRIAFVGRLVEIKGADLLLRALPEVRALVPEVECVMVGTGESGYVARLKDLAPASDNLAVRWPGYVSDIMPVLGTCGVLACPSHREPLGRVVFEAWDAGVIPVVYAGAGGSAEVVRAADAGLIYDAQTPQSLAQALVRAINLNPREAERLIANGRKWMAHHCSPENYGSAISAVLAQATGYVPRAHSVASP